MCRKIKILISNWPRKLKFSQFLQVGKRCQLLLTFLTKVTRWSRSTSKFLFSDWSKFDRWVHAENLCSILKLVFFDSWGWLSFVSTCDVFNCLFPLNVQNEIQLVSRVFCYSWLVCLLGFWLRNTFFFRALLLTDQILTQHVTLIACYFEPVGLVLWISCFYM